MSVEVQEIERLIELMRQAGLSHLALEQPEYKISITRGVEGRTTAPAAAPLPVTAAPAEPTRPPVLLPPAGSRGVPVGSPVVGLVRPVGSRLPRVGEQVTPGQRLLVVEAMKVPNEVTSPVAGSIASVLVEEGSPVEYGQTLCYVQPAAEGGSDEDETPVGVA